MPRIINAANSFLIILCLIALTGGLVYGFYSLNNLGLTISLILAFIFFAALHYYYLISAKNTSHPAPGKPEKIKIKFINILLFTVYCLLFTVSFYILWRSRTSSAIISPWQTAPKYFFAAYGLATLALIGNLAINKRLSLLLICLHYFLSFSVALIIYELGYGYDPFIHQATEKIISQTGSVLPKPFYYLGQYGLITSLYKITAAPLVWLNRALVPAFAALFLPVTLLTAAKSWLNDERHNLILSAALLALTFPMLIVTTPQNLAYILLIIVLAKGLHCKNFYDFLVILIIALAAAITHPIAGIPALLFSGFLAVFHNDNFKLKKYFYPLLTIITVLVLPALFYFLVKLLPAAPLSEIAALPSRPWLNWPVRENFVLNFIYLYGFNLKLVLLFLIAYGARLAWKFRAHCRILLIYLAPALALAASYLLVKKIPFVFLINYERNDYANRILFTAVLFLLPFIMMAIYSLAEKIIRQNIFLKLSSAFFLALLITVSLYLSYPRYDNYFNSRGYSVSAPDLEAVKFINQDAETDYIVLANQQVSAAALSRLGFKKYFTTAAGQTFYYPIPTSSPLYQYYLDMVYKKPDSQTMLKAMDLVNVKLAYFVLNKYWWAFDKILPEAVLTAQSYKSFDNGEVYVFKYVK